MTNTVTTSNLQTLNSIKLYNTAVSCLNTDVTPTDKIPDEVDCADTLWTLLSKTGIVIPYTASTAVLYTELQDITKFTKVAIPVAGDIIISPTGHGNGTVEGHVGIIAYYGILSNNSDNGLLQEKWTSLSMWIANYAGKGGLPVEFYRPK